MVELAAVLPNRKARQTVIRCRGCVRGELTKEEISTFENRHTSSQVWFCAILLAARTKAEICLQQPDGFLLISQRHWPIIKLLLSADRNRAPPAKCFHLHQKHSFLIRATSIFFFYTSSFIEYHSFDTWPVDICYECTTGLPHMTKKKQGRLKCSSFPLTACLMISCKKPSGRRNRSA